MKKIRFNLLKIVLLSLVVILLPCGLGSADILIYDPCDQEVNMGIWHTEDDYHSTPCSMSKKYSAEQARAGSGSYKFVSPACARHNMLSPDPPYFHLQWDTEYWIGFSVYIPASHTYFVGDPWMIYSQWHGQPDDIGICDTWRNPVLDMRDYSTSEFGAVYRAQLIECCLVPTDTCHDYDVVKWFHPLTTKIQGGWNDVVYHMKFSMTLGILEQWVNGEKAIDYQGPLGFNDIKGHYFTFGTYQGPNGQDLVFYFDELRIGDKNSNYDEVAPGEIIPPPTCQSQGYKCCNSCASGPHPEYNADCPGQVCCEVCTFLPTPSYTIIKTPTSPIIDGDISEFNNANTITLTNSRGNSGDYKLMWDDSALYIVASVLDTQLNADEAIRDSSLWNDDSIEMMFDTLHDAGLSLQPDDYKFFANVLNVQRDQKGEGPSWNCLYDSAVSASGTVNNNGDTDTGYDIEIAIPWSEWGVSAPIENDVWGFEVVMNDKNETGTRIYTAWSNTDGGSLNIPDKWGDIVFSAGSSCGAADTNTDNEVDILEIMAYITEWKAGNVVITDLMIGIGEWKNGC